VLKAENMKKNGNCSLPAVTDQPIDCRPSTANEKLDLILLCKKRLLPIGRLAIFYYVLEDRIDRQTGTVRRCVSDSFVG
jgi:hypothetical protein